MVKNVDGIYYLYALLKLYKTTRMKYLAHVSNNLDSEVISIYDVIKKLKEDTSYKEGITYYSLWYLTPMIAKVNSSTGRAPHFAFKKGYGGNENSGGGEGLEHALAKKIIYDNKFLKIAIGKSIDELSFSDIIIEKEFENRKYIADLYVRIENENLFELPKDSWLAVELCYKNKVKISKKAYYRKHNIAAIEIKINNEIKYEGNMQYLNRRLNGYFTNIKNATWLHNPNYKQYYLRNKEKEKAQENQPAVDFVPKVVLVSNPIPREKSNSQSLNREKALDNEPILNKSSSSFWRKLLDMVLKPFL